jgi:FMN-dependent NADH-azoreductase
MKTLLQINASLAGAEGQSSKLADHFVADWLAKHPGGHVVKRDLALDPVPHLTAQRFQAFLANPESRTEEQKLVRPTSSCSPCRCTTSACLRR